MSAVPGEERILVLADNDGLFMAIEAILHAHSGVRAKVVPVSSAQRTSRTQVNGCRLIVAAMSSPTSEPVVALVRASLIEKVGQIPLLIISDRRGSTLIWTARCFTWTFPLTRATSFTRSR